MVAEAEATSVTAETWDTEAHPWRRYGGRTIDLTLFGLVGGIIIGLPVLLLWPDSWIWIESPSLLVQFLVFVPITYAVTAVATALCIAHWASTPGKWLFGLKVRSVDGERLSLAAAFEREARVFLWGLGLGLMPLTLFMMIRSFSEVESEERARWDEAVGADVFGRPLNGVTHALIAVGTILLIAIKAFDAYDMATMTAG